MADTDHGQKEEESGMTPSKSNARNVSWVWAHTERPQEPVAQEQRDKICCIHCRRWFSVKTNTAGWKNHLKRHGITEASDTTPIDVSQIPASAQNDVIPDAAPHEAPADIKPQQVQTAPVAESNANSGAFLAIPSTNLVDMETEGPGKTPGRPADRSVREHFGFSTDGPDVDINSNVPRVLPTRRDIRATCLYCKRAAKENNNPTELPTILNRTRNLYRHLKDCPHAIAFGIRVKALTGDRYIITDDMTDTELPSGNVVNELNNATANVGKGKGSSKVNADELRTKIMEFGFKYRLPHGWFDDELFKAILGATNPAVVKVLPSIVGKIEKTENGSGGFAVDRMWVLMERLEKTRGQLEACESENTVEKSRLELLTKALESELDKLMTEFPDEVASAAVASGAGTNAMET